MFCPTKDEIPRMQKSNIIYRLAYNGKIDRCLKTRSKEHGSRKDQPMNIHLSECDAFHDCFSLFNLPSLEGYPVESLNEHIGCDQTEKSSK